MSTFNPNPNFLSGNDAPKRPRKKRWILPVSVGVAGLLIGSAMGASNRPKPVEVVKEVPGPERVVTQTVEKKVDVPKTPAACLTALDLSEQAFNYAAEALGYSNDALTAAGQLDPAGIQAAGDKMEALNPKIKALAPKVNAAKSECRASE